MSISDQELEKAIRIYERFGIVTKNEVTNLNSRRLSEDLYDLMQNKGCENMLMYELETNNYEDYYNVIYNTEVFGTNEEATSYILNENR